MPEQPYSTRRRVPFSLRTPDEHDIHATPSHPICLPRVYVPIRFVLSRSRGIKTMGIRMEKQQSNCSSIARWLEAHPLITRVMYPGLPSDPSYELHMRQATGGGCLLSFTTGNVELSKALVDALSLYKVTVSFGSTSSLVSLPCFMSHASIPAEVRAARGLPDDLVRISAGIEDEKDLIADLTQAMARAAEAVGLGPTR